MQPPGVNFVFRWLARLIAWIIGWRMVGEVPQHSKMVMLGVPHTTNQDGVVMLLLAWSVNLRVNYLVARDAVFPLNLFIRVTNGIPIDRSKSKANTVDQVVDYMNSVDKCALVIAPEGRLRRVEYWRSGFYYIALKAGVPVVPCTIDYQDKTITMGPSIDLIGDPDADMEKIRAVYDVEIHARHPERFGPIALRPQEADEAAEPIEQVADQSRG